MPPPPIPTSSGSLDALSIDAGAFRVSRTAFCAGTLSSHYHERACLWVVLEGSFIEYFSGRAIECRRGGFLLKPAAEPHRDEFDGSTQLIIEPDEKAAVNIEAASLFDRIAYERSLVAAAIASRIVRELEAQDPFTTLAVEGLTLELLVSALRAGRDRPVSRPVPVWLARVRDRLNDEPRPAAIADLAVLAQVNPAYLARCFRRCYGQSIGQYARRVRLETVARQLTETREPLSAIALRAGFADQSHLTRAFRAHWGVTPRQYRVGTRNTASAD